MIANPTRGQLNRGNELFPVLVRARELGFARWVRPSRLAPACSFFTATPEFIRSHNCAPMAFTAQVYWHRASSPQGSLNNGCYIFRFHHRPILCASFAAIPLHIKYRLHESIEAIVRRRRVLLAGFVTRMEDTRLPKCVMFRELVGGTVLSTCPLHTNSGCGKERRSY